MDKKTIMIVDDTPVNLKTLAGILREEYRILIATTGEQALDLVEDGAAPDLILLDIMMPGIDGYEVCQCLKGSSETASIPVIFITAKAGESEREKGLSLGAAAYITKPFDAGEVKKILKNQFF